MRVNPRRVPLGPRLRERRRALGITQAKLAESLDVSASYLNLIEADKRSIGGALLKRIAERLGLSIDELDGAADRRLVADLDELAGEPLLTALGIDRASSGELAGRHRAWAHALVALHRAWLDRGQSVNALADRLNHDPFLGDAVHRMLTRVASIRSASEILETVDDLGAAQRKRFVSIIGDESRKLAAVADALAAFFDSAHIATRSITPVEEVDDYIVEHDNFFADLEQAALDLRAAAGIDGECGAEQLVAYLRGAHGVSAAAHHASGAAAIFDAQAKTLSISSRAPPATRRFELARCAALLFLGRDAHRARLESSALLTGDASRRLVERVLWSYLAAAVLMPYDAFLDAALAARYDVDLVAQRFGASFEQVAHRLVTLRRPGSQAVPFALLRADAAGHVTKRFPLPRLLLPRHGNACPLWAVYAALQAPGTTVRQLAGFENDDRYLFVARAIEKPRPAFVLPRRLVSIMLACDAIHADRTVYADGLDLSSGAHATPVGPNCRLCTRAECVYRQQDPIIDAYSP